MSEKVRRYAVWDTDLFDWPDPKPKAAELVKVILASDYDSAVAVLREIAKDDYDESGNAGLARDWLREHGEEA